MVGFTEPLFFFFSFFFFFFFFSFFYCIIKDQPFLTSVRELEAESALEFKGSPEIIEPESSEDEDEEALMSKTMATMQRGVIEESDPTSDPDFLGADDRTPSANFKVCF